MPISRQHISEGSREAARTKIRDRVKIIHNAARCKKGGDEIESKHRHDFRACKCGAIFVDGLKDYLRQGVTRGTGDNFEDLEDHSQLTSLCGRRGAGEQPGRGVSSSLALARMRA